MADTTNRVAGVAYLRVDGQTFMLSGDLEYQPSGVTRETVSGQDGVHGYKETPVPGHISGTVRDAGGLTIGSLNAMTNVTVTAELANGKTVIGRNMWTVEMPTGKTAEGTIEVKWESANVIEVAQ